MPYPLGHRTTWHGPASITWASRATSQWSETDKTRAGWFRHYKWSKEKVILFDGKNILNHPALVLAMYRPWRPKFFKPPPRQATFGAVGDLCVPRTSSHFGSFGCGNTGLLCSHRMKESNDPGRTRTYNPRLRGPMPYPLGHRTTWHGPASITSASRATSQWSETDKTQAGWFRHYKWSKEKVILFDGKKHPKSSRPCFGNVPALAAPIF